LEISNIEILLKYFILVSSGEARGFKVGGLRGRVGRGCTPLPHWGPGGCAPGKIFKIQMHAGEFQRILQTKVSTLTPVIMPVNFDKVPNPFDF
jgi:hypothetical protein